MIRRPAVLIEAESLCSTLVADSAAFRGERLDKRWRSERKECSDEVPVVYNGSASLVTGQRSNHCAAYSTAVDVSQRCQGNGAVHEKRTTTCIFSRNILEVMLLRFGYAHHELTRECIMHEGNNLPQKSRTCWLAQLREHSTSNFLQQRPHDEAFE